MIYTIDVMDEAENDAPLSTNSIPDLVKSDKFVIVEVNVYFNDEWKMSMEFEGDKFIIIRELKTDDNGMEYIEERTIKETDGWMSLIEGMSMQ